MSPDPAVSLPPRWSAFLKEVDEILAAPVELHCLGGFVLAASYGLPRPTGDLDYITAIPLHGLPNLEETAGRDSAQAGKHKLYFQHVTVADVPEDYESRLIQLFPGHFSRLGLRPSKSTIWLLRNLDGIVPWTWKTPSFWRKQPCSMQAF